MADMGFIRETRGPRISFAVAPVHNALCSLCLLNQDHVDHISPWVDQTLATLTPDEKRAAELACGAAMLVGDSTASSLEEFVAELRDRDPRELVHTELERIAEKADRYLDGPAPDAGQLAHDRDRYLEVVEQLETMHDQVFDREQAEQDFARMQDPGAYRDELADTLEHFWNRYLRDEWERVRHDVEDSVRAFGSVPVPAGDLGERLKYITGRDNVPGDWVDLLADAREIVFVPSVHIGPYMILFEFDGTRAYIVGRARVPEGARLHSASLDRSELLMRLDALSDATRMRILELAAGTTITTQDVMDELALSQSSASRHLGQLAATGLLSVDGSERTKRYRVNPRRIDDVCAGLRHLVGADARAATGGRPGGRKEAT